MSKLKDDHGKDARKNDSLLHVLTTQYKTAAKKGCQATLEMAAIIVRAHDALEKTLLPAFYEDIGLAPDVQRPASSNELENSPKLSETSTVSREAPKRVDYAL